MQFTCTSLSLAWASEGFFPGKPIMDFFQRGPTTGKFILPN